MCSKFLVNVRTNTAFHHEMAEFMRERETLTIPRPAEPDNNHWNVINRRGKTIEIFLVECFCLKYQNSPFLKRIREIGNRINAEIPCTTHIDRNIFNIVVAVDAISRESRALVSRDWSRR